MFYFMWLRVCTSTTRISGAQRGHRISPKLGLQMLASCHMGLGTELGPLQGHPLFLTVEVFLQPLVWLLEKEFNVGQSILELIM